MGCVQSHQQERGGRRQSGDRHSPQHRQQQQQRHRQQQPQQNGRQQQLSRERISSEHLYENVDLKQNVASRGSSPAKTNNDDSQFRRQQFDRNSCLRHSKKRKKSSVSNPNSPATLTGSESTEQQQQQQQQQQQHQQQRVGKTSSNQNSPTNNNRPVDENGDVFKYDSEDYQIQYEDDLEQAEEQKLQYGTASSKVAALLAADSIRQPVPSANSTKPVLLSHTTTTREISNANPVQKMAPSSIHSNGREENNLPTKPTTVTLSSPTKMQKLSTSSTTTTSATAKTSVGPNQRRPGSAQTGNRVVLRTRRQAAQEEEEQRRRKNCDGPEIDQNEDCGRLI